MGKFTTSLFNLTETDPLGDYAFSFAVIQTNSGSYPTAETTADVLTLTTANPADYFFQGNATTDTVTLNLVNFYNKPETKEVALVYALIFG